MKKTEKFNLKKFIDGASLPTKMQKNIKNSKKKKKLQAMYFEQTSAIFQRVELNGVLLGCGFQLQLGVHTLKYANIIVQNKWHVAAYLEFLIQL